MPHAPTGVQEKPTPPFLGSLVTVPAIPAYAPVLSDPGGTNPVLKVTVIGGIGLSCVPQERRVVITAAVIASWRIDKRCDRRKVMGSPKV